MITIEQDFQPTNINTCIFSLSSDSESIVTASYKKIDDDGNISTIIVTLGDDNPKTRRPAHKEPLLKSMTLFKHLFIVSNI